MPRAKIIQTNFTSGVLSPKLAAREDVVYYYNGLKDGKNILFEPEGGLRRRPGKQWVQPLKQKMDAIDLTAATLSVPHGGTSGNAVDGDATTFLTTTDNLSNTNPFVVLSVDLGAAVTVSSATVTNISLSAGALNDEMFIQYSADGATWSNYGDAFDLDAAPRSRCRAPAAVAARYWRIARIGATDTAATVSLSGFALFEENGDLSDAKMYPFAYSTEDAYMFISTENHADVLKGTALVCAVDLPHTAAQLAVTSQCQKLDTMLLWHKSVNPYKIFRQGADDEFDFRAATFENIPKYDYGAGTGGVDEVQTLSVAGAGSGNKFTLELEGYRTPAISYSTTAGVTGAAIQDALRALANTSADGITVAEVDAGFTVTFSGDDGSRPWLAINVTVLSGNGVWDVARTTRGDYEGEAIMSDTRGWPRHGIFASDRLVMGGVLGKPDVAVISSLLGYYNLDITIDDDTRGLLLGTQTDQVGAIYQIVNGRHLTFFCNDGEAYVPTGTLTKDSYLERTSDIGSKEGMRVFEQEGSLLFLQGVMKDDGTREVATSLHDFTYDITVQSYNSDILSKLSSHVISDPVDMAQRKALSTEENGLLLIVNDNGTATAQTLLIRDNVNAFTPIETREGDKLLAVCVDKRQRVYWITERIIGGVPARFVEMWNDNLLLDCGGIVTMTAEETTATAAQAVYSWTFENPAAAAAIGVRLRGGRLGASDYGVDLDTKTVTLSDAVAATVAAGDTVRIASMVNEVTGLGHLEGETLQTYIDGSEGDDATVTDGTLTLPDYADTEIQYGFDFEVSGELMPLRVPGGQSLVGEKVRCYGLVLQLDSTGCLEIQANDGNWQEVSLVKLDDNVLDRSQQELLFTGTVRQRGLKGNAIGAPVKFRQPGPGPLNILSITREVNL